MQQVIRKKTYWAFDWIKGSPVKKHLNEVSSILENSDLKKAENIINKRKESLLRHAQNTTVFYHSYNGNVTIQDFPVINKNIIRQNFDAFQSNAFSEDSKVPAVTSGSTGTPFKVYHDQNKKYRNTADTLYFSRKAGYEIGNKLIYLKIWAKQLMASPLHYRMQNIKPFDVIKLTDDKIAALIEEIEKSNIKHSILGYVSALEKVCNYLDKTEKDRVKADVASIITMSEALTPHVEERLEKYFNAAVYSRYSNLENGILAQQIPGRSGEFLVNRASYDIEILKMDSNEPAEKGEAGRIVITDLFNFAMPMIRYDTGDVGAFSEKSDGFGNKYLKKVEGRKLDVLYDTSGNIVSSYIMYKNMWQYTEIKQYQLVQEDEKRYTFKINVEGDFDNEEQLINEYKTYLGKDAEFNIKYVDEIPLLDSGKRKKTVNNWKN